MINGAHVILYSQQADQDREFLRDVLGLPHVDVGGGWLIFGLPPSEVAVHPAEGGGSHELYLMCEDVEAFVAAIEARGLECAPVQNQGWGLVTAVTLPGGSKLGVYQPRHARPEAPQAATPRAKQAAKKKAAKKKASKKKGSASGTKRAVAPAKKKAAKKKAKR